MILCVTGTSTGIGKTVATAALAAALLPSGPVTAIKPAQTGLAVGADRDAEGNLSDAAEIARLSGAATIEHRRFPDPLAPLTAARRAGMQPLCRSETTDIARGFEGAVLMEGAGGVLVRLGVDSVGTPFTIVDAAADLDADVLIVAEAGLGTLTHTELPVRALRAASVRCAGIVLSRWPDEPGLAEQCNARELPELTGSAIVGQIPDRAPALPVSVFRSHAGSWFDQRWLSGLMAGQDSVCTN